MSSLLAYLKPQVDKRRASPMLSDDPTLLDELDIDTQRMLGAAERPVLAGIDPNATQVPTGMSAEPSQVVLLASCSRFD